MKFEDAVARCAVRGAIYREGEEPRKLYAKNHRVRLVDRVPLEDQKFDDWEEWGPDDD